MEVNKIYNGKPIYFWLDLEIDKFEDDDNECHNKIIFNF